MSAATRKVPCSDVGTTMPYSSGAVAWMNLVNAEIAAIWNYMGAPLTSISGTNTITAASVTADVAAITAYKKGQKFTFIPAADNTGAATINIDTLGAKSINDTDNAALAAGVLKSGRLSTIEYDGTEFRLIATGAIPAQTFSHLPGMVLRDEKSQNTAGGTFTSGAWQTRTLNTAVVNTISGGSLSSNQFTLPAGTYYLEWSCPAYQVVSHQTRLQDITHSSTLEEGTSMVTNSGDAVVNRSEGCWTMTLSTPTTFEIQHRCSTTGTTTGFGNVANLTTEVYSVVKIWKD